jgi:hypothetical protein
MNIEDGGLRPPSTRTASSGETILAVQLRTQVYFSTSSMVVEPS